MKEDIKIVLLIVGVPAVLIAGLIYLQSNQEPTKSIPIPYSPGPSLPSENSYFDSLTNELGRNRPSPVEKVKTNAQNFNSVQPQGLAPEVEKQLGDIMKFVMATPGEPTQATKSNFWLIAQKGGATTKNLEDTRMIAASFVVDYMEIFYQDALSS